MNIKKSHIRKRTNTLKKKIKFLEYWQINFPYLERVDFLVRVNTEPFFNKENRDRVSKAGLTIKREFDEYNKELE